MVYEDSLFEFISTVGRLYILTNDRSEHFEQYHELIEKLIFLTNFLRSTSKHDEMAHILGVLKEWQNDFRNYFAGSTYMYEHIAAQRFMRGTLHFDEFVTHRYRLLVNHEHELLKKHMPSMPKKYLFVGGGPFPVSAMLMALAMKNVSIYILDKSVEACITAADIIAKMHLGGVITVLPPSSIETYSAADDYDVIHFASMVGLSEDEKVQIYGSLAKHISPGKHILSRCSVPYSLTSMLYAGFPEEHLKEVFHVKERQEHQQPVVVSSILLQRR